MLEVMEKNVKIEDNYNAAKWTVEAGLGNTIQLVVGMPGESPETIRETIEYCQYCLSLDEEQDPRAISINFAQALPGTPSGRAGRSITGSSMSTMRRALSPGIAKNSWGGTATCRSRRRSSARAFPAKSGRGWTRAARCKSPSTCPTGRNEKRASDSVSAAARRMCRI